MSAPNFVGQGDCMANSNGKPKEDPYPWELRFLDGGLMFGQVKPSGVFCNTQEARLTYSSNGGAFFINVAPANKKLCPLGMRQLVATPVSYKRFKGRKLVDVAKVLIGEQDVHVRIPKHIEWELSQETVATLSS